MANSLHASATHFPSGQPPSGPLDESTLETLSSRGGRVAKSSSPRTSVVRTDRLRRKQRSQTPRGRQTPSSQLVHFEDSTRFSGSGEPNYSHSHVSPRAEIKRFHSSPNVLPSPNQITADGDVSMDLDDGLPLPADEKIAIGHDLSQSTEETQYHMVKQLKTHQITHEQLVPEVRSIYRGLAMVEEKCIKLDKQQSELKVNLTQVQWQALISIHSTLLHEHHDFFLSSQHPAAQSELTELAAKYSMPARMWRYGIHSLLELLRQKLPGSLEYMLNFIYTAYNMVTLLLENIPAFRATWIECLGDLARYRMAIEESDMRDREVWATVSQYWYNQEADLSHDIGRVQHHLAVLARPDALAQLFHYTKSLICRCPFLNARESIALLFNSFRGRRSSMAEALISTHGVLVQNGPSEEFVPLASHYLSLLRREIPQLDAQGQRGAFVMSSNIAAILQYGEPKSVLALEFSQKSQATATERYELALQWTTGSLFDDSEAIPDPVEITSKLSSQGAFQGGALAFYSLAVLLDHLGDPKAYAGIHTALSFVWSLAIHPLAMEKLEPMIPWLKIVQFLNTLLRLDTDFEKIEGVTHPRFTKENENITARNRARNRSRIEREKRERDGREKKGTGENQDEEMELEIPDHLPEDFLIRGQMWSELYYPKGFFEGGPLEHDRSFINPLLLELVRRHRCLWLGVRLSTVCGIIPLRCSFRTKMEQSANKFDDIV